MLSFFCKAVLRVPCWRDGRWLRLLDLDVAGCCVCVRACAHACMYVCALPWLGFPFHLFMMTSLGTNSVSTFCERGPVFRWQLECFPKNVGRMKIR